MKNLEIYLSELTDFIIDYKNANSSMRINSICTDSRKIEPGDWFICLKGESHDGHKYIEKVIEAGAGGIIFEGSRDIGLTRGIQVEDTTKFLGKLSGVHLRHIAPTVIAITGSNGKTSVKEMLSHLLNAYSGNKVCYSQGNFNNQFGVPYTILDLKPGDKYLVIELGTNHPGEIRYLSEIVNSDISIITSISMGHAGNFGSPENIVEEKSDIITGMKSGGSLFVPESLFENQVVMEKTHNHKVSLRKPDNKCSSPEFLGSGTNFNYEGKKIFLPAPGRHQFENCRLVLSVLEEITGNVEKVKDLAESLSSFEPVKGRLQKISHKKYNLWDDSYNANPASFAEAIEFLASTKGESGLFGAFGMMGELGKFSDEEHRKLGEIAGKSGMSAVFFSSGDEIIRTAFKEGWLKVKTSASILTKDNTYSSLSEGFKFLVNQMEEGDNLLVKGSRSTRMERMFVFFS